MTYEDACNIIVEADILRDPEGNAPDAKQIFNSSPAGELYQIHVWYNMAKAVLAESKSK